MAYNGGDIVDSYNRQYKYIKPADTNPGTFRLATPPDAAHGGAGGGIVIDGVAPIKVDQQSITAVITVDEATDNNNGVVKLANAGDITAGTSGKVVTADQLRYAIDNVDLDLVSTNGSITIDKTNAPTVDINVKEGLFLFADFSLYPDVSTAP